MSKERFLHPWKPGFKGSGKFLNLCTSKTSFLSTPNSVKKLTAAN
jgi:hypothetical protein